MKISRKWWRGALLVLVLSAVAAWVVRTWVVMAVIRQQVGKVYAGRVEIDSWYLNTRSAGLVGVRVHEGPGADSPVWLTAGRVATDASLSRLIRGRAMPTRVTIERPAIDLRFARDNRLTTRIPFRAGDKPATQNGPSPTLPEIVVEGGSGTIRQEGRQDLHLAKVDGTLRPEDGKLILRAATADPLWGRFKVLGDFTPDFQSGQVALDTSKNLQVDQDKTSRLPFVPTEVWDNLQPNGPVEARVRITYKLADPTPVRLHTEVDLHGVSTRLETLAVQATDSTGRIVVDDDHVHVVGLKGRTLGGSLAADGTLSFAPPVPRVDLKLGLTGIDVTRAPKTWQLEKLGADGRLSGEVALKVALPKSGPDLTGTSGEAVIEGGLFQGIPIKSLAVSMRAEGRNLEYDTGIPGMNRRPNLVGPDVRPLPPGADDFAESAFWGSLEEAVPVLSIWNGGRTVSRWIASEARKQAPAAGGPDGKGGIKLPKTVSTEIELEDVELDQILSKAKAYGIQIPVPVSGKFSLKAKATIPIATPGDLRKYRFHGESTLKAASIDYVDLGQIEAKLDLIDGVLELSDFRGQLVDHPSGDPKHPPVATALPPRDAPLTPGGFRGGVRVPLAPRGRLTARIEGVDLPLGELAAPALPVPTPLSGLLSLAAEASVDVANLADPAAWVVDGHADSRRITYQQKVLDRVATTVHLEKARLDVKEFAATLMGQPLTAGGHVEVAAPYRFGGRVDVQRWELHEILGFLPRTPRTLQAAGSIDAQGEAGGTIAPFSIVTRGSARVLHARTEAGPLGTLVFQWLTDRDVVTITGLEAQAFGGKLRCEAKLPTRPGPPLEASAGFQGIDLASLAAATLGDEPKLTGIAAGKVHVRMPLDASSIHAEVSIRAPDLTVQGVPAESAQVKVKGVQDRLDFEITADSLGGKVRLTGSAPVNVDRTKMIVNGELHAAGFQMLALWRSLGLSGEITRLDGLAAVVLNLRAATKPFALWSRGIFELRDLHLESPRVPIGGLRGEITRTPTAWRIDNLAGDIFGGPASGEANGETRPGKPPTAAFDFRIDRASLARMMVSVPALSRDVEGVATVRINGRLDGQLGATSDVRVPNAKILNIPLTNLHFPAEIAWNPASGSGSLTCRQWTTRVAGGSLRGSVSARLGGDQPFQAETQATDFDIELLSRLTSDSNRAASGKVTGKLSLAGHNPAQPATYRGRFDANVADASLVEVPVFKEILRLTSIGGNGGLFEVGEVHGLIANQTFNISECTLEGRVIQIHTTGTVTFAGGLNLEVLVNTNRLIPESGQNLIRIIPGLGEAIGRSQDALLKVASFLSNRLIKFRVTGTAKNPTVTFDAGVAVTDSAAGFFSSVLRLPIGRK